MTAFVIESYKRLQPDSADTAAALLLRISNQLTPTTSGSQFAALPSPFQASRAAVLCNVCWFLSLMLSLGCALGAILIRQWVLNYLQHPRDESTAPRRARMRQYLFEGIEHWKMAVFVDILPAMLHFSLFLFSVGLVAFSSEVNTILVAVVSFVELVGLVGYTILTFLPVQWPECPYQTPLSAPCIILFSLGRSIWKSARSRAAASATGLGLRERRDLVLNDSGDRDELDIRGLRWLQTRLTEGREAILYLNAIPEFLQSFQTGRQGPVAHRIILEVSINDIYELLRVCRSGRYELKKTMEGTAQTCLNTILALARDTSNRAYILDHTLYFRSDLVKLLGTIARMDTSVAPLAACALATVLTRLTDRSRFAPMSLASRADITLEPEHQSEPWSFVHQTPERDYLDILVELVEGLRFKTNLSDGPYYQIALATIQDLSFQIQRALPSSRVPLVLKHISPSSSMPDILLQITTSILFKPSYTDDDPPVLQHFERCLRERLMQNCSDIKDTLFDWARASLEATFRWASAHSIPASPTFVAGYLHFGTYDASDEVIRAILVCSRDMDKNVDLLANEIGHTNWVSYLARSADLTELRAVFDAWMLSWMSERTPQTDKAFVKFIRRVGWVNVNGASFSFRLSESIPATIQWLPEAQQRVVKRLIKEAFGADIWMNKPSRSEDTLQRRSTASLDLVSALFMLSRNMAY